MIPRAAMIEQSVTDFARAGLTARGYMDDVEIVDSFQGVPKDGALTRNYVTTGFNFDNEAEAAECGSSFSRRLYSQQFFVFGSSQTFGSNIAGVLEEILDVDTIPLKDISQAGAPVIDQLAVDQQVTHERQIVPDPEPWQQFVWTVTVHLVDEYYPALI